MHHLPSACLILLATVSFQSASARESRLSEMFSESAAQGWGQLHLDQAVGGTPLAIAGRKFTHGLGTHANSTIRYDLAGSYDTFRAWVGVDDNLKDHPEAAKSSVVFKLLGDGRLLFDSGVMRRGDAAKAVVVPVTGVTELTLEVTDAGDGIACDHADWAEAVLITPNETATRSDPKFTIQAGDLKLGLDPNGGISGLSMNRQAMPWPVTGSSGLAGCRQSGAVVVKSDGTMRSFTRTLKDRHGHECTLTDRYSADGDAIRWDMEITSPGQAWTAPIHTRFNFENSAQRLVWTAWGTPDFTGTRLSSDLAPLVQTGKAAAGGAWSDPLAAVGFLNRTWHYGNVAQGVPVGSDFVVMPMVSVLDPKGDAGLSIVLSPDDTLLNLDLATTAAGGTRWSRQCHRLGEGRTLRFTAWLVAHEASWRGGLRFMTERFPAHFNPPNPRAHAFAGCGAYATGEQEIDVAKFKRMAFGFNWKLSDDFPYMGMFIPPVKTPEEEWTRSGDEQSAAYKGPRSSCKRMNDYAKYMKQNGFGVLSYFNVTEFGKNMNRGGRRKPVRNPDDPDLWQDPAGFIEYKLPTAIVDPGIQTCYLAYIVDVGDPGYQKFMLEQADRNTRMLPDTDGICIDRADWLRLYNRNADDGVSWVDGKPARSLFRSWTDFMAKLGPQLHGADKLIFCNMMTMRLELCRELDGIYTEFGNNANALNGSALLGLRKPVVCWTYNETLAQPDPDSFMQRHLHMGCFPTAPYPANNHCINPEPGADRLYQEYGPLLDALRGRRWVLAPHCVEAVTPGVKANLFEVPGGYALPVTFGGAATAATIRVRGLAGMETLAAEAIHPGAAEPVRLAATASTDTLEIAVPLKRGCAMIRLRPN